MAIMPAKSPVIFSNESRILTAMGERIRLARKRRKLSTATIAERAGIARGTLYRVEAGDAAVTLGTYLRVLAALNMASDLEKIAADDEVGRRLQDIELRSRSST